MSPPKLKIEIGRQNGSTKNANGVSKAEKKKPKYAERFDYGNYNRYSTRSNLIEANSLTIF